MFNVNMSAYMSISFIDNTISIYIYLYHTWKKVGILATGCRRYGGKKHAKRQKNDVKLRKQTQNQRIISPKRQV